MASCKYVRWLRQKRLYSLCSKHSPRSGSMLRVCFGIKAAAAGVQFKPTCYTPSAKLLSRIPVSQFYTRAHRQSKPKKVDITGDTRMHQVRLLSATKRANNTTPATSRSEESAYWTGRTLTTGKSEFSNKASEINLPMRVSNAIRLQPRLAGGVGIGPTNLFPLPLAVSRHAPFTLQVPSEEGVS